MAQRLPGYTILILETREEAQFSRLLADQGAHVVQCPMFAIEDAADPAPVADWIARCIARPFDDLVLTTGEGLRRLVAAADAAGRKAEFVAAIGESRTLARGPKPGKALREIGLEAHLTTATPTSEGIVDTLSHLPLAGRRVGLQLYPERDHTPLIRAIEGFGARVDAVTPYTYNDAVADAMILSAIDEMIADRIDAIALTSSGQVRRLFDVAQARGCTDRLRNALARTPIASVGPVVTDALQALGLKPDITPAEDAFFMKPLISAMAAALGKRPPRASAATG